MTPLAASVDLPPLRVFGSSQLNGCPGDFCSFDISYIEDTALGGAGFTTNRSDFRKELRKRFETDKDIGARRTDSDGVALLSEQLKGDRVSSRKRPNDLHSSSMSDLVKLSRRLISLNAIVQARAEMPIVKNLLMRHKIGEQADYYAQDSYSDVASGAKLPSKYYEKVECCEACYKVYQLVETAREKSIRKLKSAKRKSVQPVLQTGMAMPASIVPLIAGTEDASKLANSSLLSAIHAIQDLNKLDVAEIRSMTRPPAAVIVVLEAVTAVLTGRIHTFQETRRLLGNGDVFLQSLRDFQIGSIDSVRLRLVQPYVDNPIFRPEHVVEVSKCASKFCAWVLGTVQAARWMLGEGHPRTDLIPAVPLEPAERSLTFVEKLEKRRMKKSNVKDAPETSHAAVTLLMHAMPARPALPFRVDDPQLSMEETVLLSEQSKKTVREKKAQSTAQKKSNDRLASQNKSSSLSAGVAKEFRCADGVTLMQYIVLGEYSIESECCNFIIVNDFFDTCDAMSILMKPIVAQHPHCQVLCFNYPGQASTVWPRPPQADKDRGAKEPVLNNDWIADRMHELLQYTESTSDFVLFSPFHLVGIGNGACIASSFVQKYGASEMYAGSLRSLVAVNGFLYPDAQLTSILHSASQVFESTPHNRPDIPISFWSRFMFSDDYLARIHTNLVLNIYTAVLNPITNDGRQKIARGCMLHRDLRGGLSPDNMSKHASVTPVRVPLIILQSTENALVNASNVDSFLIGRHARHLWSHQQNPISDYVIKNASDVHALPWVGMLSSKPETYAKCSVLGKGGLRMILDTLKNVKGAFVMWSRSGHCVYQESKQSFLDLMDALSCPSEEYFGLSPVEESKRPQIKIEIPRSFTPIVDILFTIEPSTRTVDPELLKEPVKPKKTVVSVSSSPIHPKREDLLTTQVVLRETILSEDVLASAELRGSENSDNELSQESLLALTTESVPSIGGSIVVTETTDFTGIAQERMEDMRNQLKEVDAAIKVDAADISRISTLKQRGNREWADIVPSVDTALALESELRHQEALYYEKEEIAMLELKLIDKDSRELIDKEQEERRKAYFEEDQMLLDQLKGELEKRRRERDEAEVQRRLQIQAVEQQLVDSGLLSEYAVPPEGEAVMELAPLEYSAPMDLPKGLVTAPGMINMLDRLLETEKEAKALNIDFIEDFDRVKKKMAQNQVQRDQRLRNLSVEEQQELFNESASLIQRRIRGVIGRKKACALKLRLEQEIAVGRGVVILQALARRKQAKKRVQLIRYVKYENLKHGAMLLRIQSVFRGYLSRRFTKRLRRMIAATHIQRCFRGFIGRCTASAERARLAYLKKKNDSAMAIQSTWRMKVAKEEFRSIRIHALAAIEIQRCFRGHIGRKTTNRRREWEAATPGPERIKLGLSLIEESRMAFERQQEELDAIHRAQERAEARVSHIHADLRESEKELIVLERELLEIDQIENDLINLTHERNLLRQGVTDAAGIPHTAARGEAGNLFGKEFERKPDPDTERKNKAEAFALEMTIQIKRAEREKKRQELETEFALVFQEVEKKKQALDRLESSLADMEATRERKDREFRRLQSNLMQLLSEQKQELDSLREKGIELETATALTASAAVATANKAMEHEKRSKTMFSQTEELMKFQFMSMSLSYFSSLNMLKQLRDMNADTTSSAVASSANAAAAAAASSIAANLPNIQKLDIGADDFVELNIQKKRAELAAAEHAEMEAKRFQATPMPDSVNLWTVSDVCRWMDSLLLSEYNSAFKEARIDGPFLMELREVDMIEVLGITHRLHVRKIIVSREKLRPLSEQEASMKFTVQQEDTADLIRSGAPRPLTGQGAPDTDAVFSQCRNGHIKRVEEAINLGFKVDTEDEKGNTLLLVAAQNSNKRLVELLLFRGADINHQNAQGNTALHFALTYDSDGTLGEYLIAHGANDMLENIHGLTPYDGVG